MNTIVIRPKTSVGFTWNELQEYRELLYYFAWRDLKVRYKQTIIGIAWALFQPLFTMVVFTIFFNRVAGITANGIPYALFSYSGLIYWNLFSSALSRVSDSIASNQAVITKVYFPRLIVPLSSTLVSLVDFACAGLVFIVLLFYFHTMPSLLGILLMPALVFLTCVAATGIGLFLAALNVKYRDVRHALPFFIQIGLFLTPVIYPASNVPPAYMWAFSMNPMAGIIGAAQASMFGHEAIDFTRIGIGTAVSIVCFVFGLRYFAKEERGFGDRL